MKDAREFEGKTIDEAIEKACVELSVPREKLHIEILAEGSQGLFGLGSRKARISASPLSFDISLEEEPVVVKEKPVMAEKPRTEKARAEKPRTEKTKTERPAADKPRPEAPRQMTAPGPEDENLGAEAKKVLEGVLTRMGFNFPTSVEITEEYIIITIEGDGSGLLIGKGGQTLDAIQYIVNKAVSRNGRELKRIILDTENYRDKKMKNLVALAEKVGEKVRRTKKPIALNPMNAHDRRIVHLALQNEKGIITKSRGEGALRKIIVIPSKKR
jgi:spoIIIJ-associated protein